MDEQPLSGVRVVEVSHYIAGPFCTKLLGDFGAEVIKVEHPEGDPARATGPFPGDIPHPEKSGLFLHLNTNKLGITLNLKTETGQKILKELVREADVLVESFRPGAMASLGLSYEELSQVNPNLIMTSISNFGQTGPYRDLAASELVLSAMGSAQHQSGLPGRYPPRWAGNHVQYQAGNCAAMATLFAFYGREYQGLPGQWVDISIFETQVGSYNIRMPYLVAYAYHGERRPRFGAAVTGYPSGYYPCKDGYINITAGGVHWPRVAAALGRPELAQDPRFALPLGQLSLEGKEEFEATIWLPWLLERTKLEALEHLQKFEILCGAVNTVQEAVENPQMEARQYFVPIEHPLAGTFRYPGAPMKTSDGWWQVHRPAPTLGQHNEEVYCRRLGYAKEDLVRLRERGVI